ncbi:ESPR-type extended signal peptide-containing protein [Megasphaera elsdenii]|uniref:ESPR-type extended signal peptide-containing protein n=1 Tax=Megasphaera elsdenii TaxID=907 RepID=UPI000513A20B|nr:ESPR-type extended signal peptide-containing protein [Megasphaera elsdenii]KGI89842.1 hypothetical protein JY94_03090 [Megasphaera elsdenii]
MNKVFKVIWSKAKSAWIVVSELAKNHDAKGGSCHDGRKGNAWLIGAITLALVLGNGTAWAADPLYGTSNERPIFGGITIGEYPAETGYLSLYGNFMINGAYGFYDTEKHSFSFGQPWVVAHNNSPSPYAYALGETHQVGDYSFAVGYHAQAGKYSLVLGNDAGIANNDYAIGLGPKTAAGSYGVAIGNGTSTGTGGIAIGSAYSNGSTNVNAANANDPFSIAIGTGSEVQQNGTGNIAIGYMAQNTAGADAIVLGAFSKSDYRLNKGQQGYAPWEGSNTGNVNNSNFKNSLSSATWKSTKGGLSIGDITGDKSAWITRQISGVAAGTQDTDAVNVAQLKASMTTLSSKDGSVKITPKYNDDGSRTFDLSASGGSGSGSGGHFVSVTKKNSWESDDSLKNAGNYNNDGATGTQSTAVGVNAKAQTQGTALGNGATAGVNASNTGATAIGTGSVANGTSSVALGQNASAQNDNAVAIGHGAGAYANSVSIGSNAKSTEERSVHIGSMTDSNTTTGSASVSIGADAKATADGAASLGTGAVASGTDALALGQNSSSTGNGSVAIGYQTQVSNGKEHATAVGTSAEANATEGTVLGYNAKVNADKGVALGSGAFVAAENDNKTSVALGAGSQVNNGDTVGTASMAIKDTYGETSDSTTYNFAGTNPDGTVSVGHTQDGVDHTRTLTHVAAGRVSSTSTDAINGSQLYGVTQSIEKVEKNVADTATRYYSVNGSDTGAGSNYQNDGAHGTNSLAAGNKAAAYGVGSVAIGLQSLAGMTTDNTETYASIAIGPYAKAQGAGSIALGNSTQASGFGSLALGGGAKVTSFGGVALGGTTSTTAVGGVALGTGSQASTAPGVAGYLSSRKAANQADSVWTSTIGAVSVGGGTFKVGSETKTYTRQITNLAAGTADTDAVNVAQLKAVEQEGISLTGNDSQKVTQALGGNFNITGDLTGDALKDGKASTANLGVRKNAAGGGLEVVMTTTPSFDTVTANRNISVTNSSTEAGTSDISISGTGLSMGSKKITNLKAGSDTTDAVNYGQLSAVSSDLSAFENKTIQVGGNDGGTISRKLGENPILIQGAGTKDNKYYSGTNLRTYVDQKGVLQILLDKELLEDRIDVGSALANPTDSRVNHPVVLGTDNTIGYVGINGRDGTSAVITAASDSAGTTRLTYTDEKGKTPVLASLDDGLTFGGDNSTQSTNTSVIARSLQPGQGNYLQITGGADASSLTSGNIGVQADPTTGTLSVQLAQNLTGLTSAQFGDGVTVNGTGLIIGSGDNPVQLTSAGLNNGGHILTGVKKGSISETSTDAINGSQLTNILNADGSAKGISFGAESAAGSHTNPTSVAIGGTVTMKGAGGDSAHKNLSTSVTNKGELTVTMAPEIQENKIYVGTQIPKESSPTGRVNYPIILGEKTVGTDTYGYVGIKGKNKSQLYLTADHDASGNTRLDYLDTQNNAHLVALTSDGYTFAGDTGTPNTLALNSTLSITGGINDTGKLTTNNIGVVSSGNGVLTVELAKDLTNLSSAAFGSGDATTTVNGSGVTAPAYKVGTTTYIDSNGLHANSQKVTAVQAGALGTDSTDAVNGSQLFATNQKVSANTTHISNLTTRLDGAGMTFAGDSGSTTVKLNGTLPVKGADSNLTVTGDADGLKIGLSKTLTGLTSVEVSGSDFNTTLTGDGLKIIPTSGDSQTSIVFTASDGINLGNRKITGLAQGDISSSSTEAVNGGQLFAVKTTADQAAADATKHSSVTVAGSTDGSNVTSGNLLLTKTTNAAGGNQYDLKLNDVLTLGTGNTPITLDGTNGTVTFKNGANTTLKLDGSAGTITGLTNTSYTSLDSLIEDKAASEGELKQVAKRVLLMADNGVVNAGNSGFATLKMGQTNTVAGSAVASGKTVDKDYSDANITTVASGDNQGNTTTHIYMKKDLVGNSMNVGTIGDDGNIAAPVASLSQAASTATANGESIGQLYLAGEKRLGTGESGNTSATLHVKDVIGSNLTNASEATTRLLYTNESGTENILAVVGKDGLQFAGDRGDYAKVTLNHILNIKGGTASTAALTNGNIAVTSDGNDTLTIQLAKDLAGLSSAVFVENDFKSTINGDGITITPNNTAGTAQSISLTKDTISMGNRKIQDVADGDITTADSKEAVNGGQLYGVKQTAESAQIEAAKHTVVTANESEPANSTTGNVVLTSSDTQGKTTYNIKLNNKVTLGSGANQVVLDGSDTGTSSFGNIILNAGSGAITAGSLLTSGMVTANGGVTVEDISLDPKTNTITGLNNTTFDQSNLQANRAATEGQLQSLVDQISAGTVTGGTTGMDDGTNTHVSSKTENKVTTYTVNVDDALTHMSSATFEKKDDDGKVTQTSVLNANGLILGTDTDTTAARFTRSGISAGSQQIKQLGSGITGTDGTVSTYDTTATGQGDYNNAASIGDVQTILHAAQDVFAGNNSSQAILTLGKTATFKGADVVDANGIPLTDTALSSKLKEDYSNANITTATSAGSDGSVTTNFYLKKNLVGRSLSLGTIDSSTGAVVTPGAKLSSQVLSNTDSTQIGHLFLAGEKQTGDNQTGYTSADFYVKDDKGSYLTDADKPVTRVFFNDETGTAYELATLSDGFHVVGDNSSVQTSLKLNKTLKVNGGISDSDRLTTGNIGVLASQTTVGEDSTLTIQLAKNLTALSSAAFTGHSTNVVVDGKGIMVTPSTGTDAEKAAGTFALSTNNVSMGSQQVHYVQAGTADMDAVNVKQLSPIKTTADQAAAEAKKHSSVTVAGSTEGTDVTSGNLLLTKTNPNSVGGNNYDLKLNDIITLGGNSTTPITLDGTQGLITFKNGSNTTLQMDGKTGSITGLANTTWDKDTVVVSNRAASEGQLQSLNNLLDSTKTSGITIAGTSDTGSVLQLGKKAAFVGSAVQGGKVIADDYSDANVTTVTSGSDGNTTTHFYLKQDFVGRSLTLGTIGSDGNVANSDRTASLYQAQAADDTAMVGHLFLAGEKRTKPGGNPDITYTSVDLYVKDGAEGDKGDLKNSELPVTRVYYTDEGNETYALATMKDGFHVAGDSGTDSDLLLNQKLTLQGNGTAQTDYTSGNIGIHSDGNGTLDVQLKDTLTGLKNISFAGSTVSIGQEGIHAGGKKITNVQDGTEDTDAVNKKQLTNAQAAATTELVAGSNVTIGTPTTATDGHKVYTVNADFSGADVSGSNAVVYDTSTKDKVTLGGSSSTTPVKLTHLADGEVNSTSTDAVTGRQLNEVLTYRNQTINVAGDTGSEVKLNHGNKLTVSGDPNISTSSSGSDTASNGTLQVSLANNVYLKGLHIGSNYPTHDATSVDSVALTADSTNQTGILTLRGDATHVSDTYPRAQADISVFSADPDQTYMAAPFLQEVYQTSSSGTTTRNQPVRLAYRDNYNTAHQIATLDDGYIFSGDNGDKNLTEKLNGTVALRGMDNDHAAKITSETANTYLTKNNIGVVTKPKVLDEHGSTQDGQVEIRLAKDLTGLTSATFTNDNGDTAVIDAKNLKLTLKAQAEGKSPVSLTSSGLDNGNNQITHVAAGTADTDAVNYGQIKSIIGTDNNVKGLSFTGDTGSVTKHLGDTLQIFGGTDADTSRNITTRVGDDGTLYVNLNRQLQLDGLHIGQKNSSVASLTTETVDLKDGTTSTYGMLSLKGVDQAQANITTTMGTTSLASSDPTTTRLTYNNGNVGNAHEIAILEDGLRFTGDNYMAAGADTPEQNVVKKQLDQTLSITGGQTDMNALTKNNIGVVGDATKGTLNVQLSKSLHGLTDIYMGDTAAEASHLDKTGLYLSPTSSKDYKAKFTADQGISAGDQRIQNVADGTDTSDAATVGQLKEVESKASKATTLTVNHGQADGNLVLTHKLDKDGLHHTYDVALNKKVTVGGSEGDGQSITLDGIHNTINGGSYVKFGGQTSSTGGIGTSPLAIGWQSAELQDVITEKHKEDTQTGNYITGLSNTSWDPLNVGYSPSRAATEGQLRDVEKQVWENPITFLGNHDADKTAEESQGIKATLDSKVRIIGTGTGEAGDFDASNLNVIVGKTPDGKSDALIIQMKKAPSFTTVNAGTPDAQGVHPVSVGRVTVTRDGKTETVDGVVITDGPMITKDGINNYGKQITHLKSGGIYNEEDKKYHYESDEVGTNAATIQDVKNIASAAAQSEVEAKRVTVSGVDDNITVTPAADNPNQYQVKLSDTLKLGQDSKSNPNILIEGQNGKVTVGSGSTGNNSVVIDGNGGTVTIGNGTSGHQMVTISGNDGTMTGLTNKTWDANNIISGRAATEDQLKKVADSVSNLDKAASKTDYQLVGEKDKEGNYTGSYQVSDGNQVKLHVQDSMHPDQVKDITIDNVAKASDLGDVFQISEDIQNKENNNVVGALNNLNQKVKEAASGSWESQINGETVKKVKAGDVQNFTSGDNIQLSNDNGAIQIATRKDVSFDKVTIGSGTSGHSRVTISGKDGTMTGLTNKTWDANNIISGRAATEDQLEQAVSDAKQAAQQNDTHVKANTYKVSDDHKVSLDVVDGTGAKKGSVVIDNVAKATDIGDISNIDEDIRNKENNNIVDSLNNLNKKIQENSGNVQAGWTSKIDGVDVKTVTPKDKQNFQNFTSGDNIQLSNDNGAIKIATRKDVSFDKVTIGSDDSQMTLDKDGLQAGKVKVSHSEINAGDNRIQHVADGTEKDDAATVGQVDTKVDKVNAKVDKVADAAGTAIDTLGNHINRLDRRINKVGAGAAALAALHPDPNSDDDLSFSAGIGNYRGSTAAAIGAFYRPSDNVTVSMGATVGNGENMVNAGVTIGVGEGVGRNPSTRKDMIREISQLKEANAAKEAEVRDLKKQVQTLQKQNEDTQEKLKRIMEKLGI